MSDSNLTSKIEQAVISYLVAKRLSDGLAVLNTYTGESNEDMAIPAVKAVVLEPGEPEAGLEFTGNLWFHLRTIVISTAGVDATETTTAIKTAHDALVAWVFDAMMEDDLASQLSAQITAFYCQAAIPQGMEYEVSEDNAFMNTIRTRVYCNAKDL